MHGVERGAIGVTGQPAEWRLDRKGRNALDQFFPRLAVGDEVGDRDPADIVLLRERLDLRADHDRAVVIGELADDGDGRQLGEFAEVDRRLGVARAHQHPALLGDEREHMAGANEIGGAHVGVGERAHRVAALFGGNAGRQPVARRRRKR